MSNEKEGKKSSVLDKVPFLKKLKTIKHIEIIIFVLFIIIALLILFSDGSKWLNFSSGTNENSNLVSETYFSTNDYIAKQESKLKDVLQSIDGAGDVKVMMSVKQPGEIIYARNTEEKVVNNVVVKTDTIAYVTKNGKSEPLILMEKLPEIDGVIIVCKGAGNVQVKLDIITAVQTVLKLPNSSINVFM